MLLQQFICGKFEERDGSKKPNNEFVKDKFTKTVLSAQHNKSHYPTHRRHPSIHKNLQPLFFILAGPMAYELIPQNMPQGLPSIRTVQSAIHSEYTIIPEGYFRFDELRKHIDHYNAPLCVSVAEDATGIVGRMDYDNETDRCVGFFLP